jgi:magnesium-transporting ATPase (P-type)
MKKTLVNWLGLLGLISLLSYTAMVLFAPLGYPGYDWKSQAVSDLSASNSPSLTLATQLNALFFFFVIVCVMMVCVAVQGRLNKTLRAGVYSFAVMTFVTAVGYTMFPLTESGYAGTFQDFMHGAVTVAVVLLSIFSLVLIMIGGYRKRCFLSLAVWATIALTGLLVGGIGVNVVPPEYFGIVQRVSLFSVTGFNAVLGVYLFAGKLTLNKANQEP